MRSLRALCLLFFAVSARANDQAQAVGSTVRAITPIAGQDSDGKARPVRAFSNATSTLATTSGGQSIFGAIATSLTVGRAVDSSSIRTAMTVASTTNAEWASGAASLQGSFDGVTGWWDLGSSATLTSGTQTAPLGTPPFLVLGSPISVMVPYIRVIWKPSGNQQEVITTVADNNGSLAGKYFLITAAQDSPSPTASYPNGKAYAFWFKVSGTGSAPTGLPAGYVPYEIDINTNDSATAVATAIATATSQASYGIQVSTDGGLTWHPSGISVSPFASSTPGFTTGVATNGTSYCAMVGTTNPYAYSMTSTDGYSWSAQHTVAAGFYPGPVYWGNNQWLAARGSNPITPYVSDDCSTWVAKTAPTGTSGSYVAHGGLWLFAGSSGVYSSGSPITTWTQRLAGSFTTIASSGTLACVTGSGTYSYSSDGLSWSSGTTTAGTGPNIFWDGQYFISASTGVSAVRFAVSTDCQNWSPRLGWNDGVPVSFGAGNGVQVAVGGISKVSYRSTDHWTTWTSTLNTQTVGTSITRAVLWDGSKFMTSSSDQNDWYSSSYLNTVILTAQTSGGMLVGQPGTSGFTLKIANYNTQTINAWVAGY